MSISYKKGYGQLITAKNWVGTVYLPRSKSRVEILPKIERKKQPEDDSDAAKKVLLKML